ncbi:MAG: peptide ABC transporter substrate-binding protein [Parcubacteria group bacterium]|nr:peptide ABC transporter substrate-binding protein [Parcubacteria group bacterium]
MDELDFFYNSNPKKEKTNKDSLLKRLKNRFGIDIFTKNLPHVLTKKERYLIFLFILLTAAGIIAIPISSYYHYTKAAPDFGGTYKEGILGEPRFINPVLEASDADRDLTALLYSGLMKNDGKGNLIPDLASHYELSNDGLSYTFFLKKNVKWHDGKPFTADDVIFTIFTIQNADFNSAQRINWQGVEAEKVDDYIVRFSLKNKYAQFIVNTQIGILPQHVWADIKPMNFARTESNLRPIGTGPYKFVKLKKDSSGKIIEYDLEAYKEYHGGKAYIQKFVTKSYASEEEILDAYKHGEIDGISFVSNRGLKKLQFQSRFTLHQINLPRYFALFLNPNQSKLLSDKNIRIALSYGTEKKAIINDILDGEAITADSPMLPEILKINSDIKKYDFNPEFAKQILDNAGWQIGNDGVREKQEKDKKGNVTKTEKLELNLITSNWSELLEVANLVKNQWANIGVKLNIQSAMVNELQQTYIKNRDYQIMLFGEVLTIDPDPFSFWHSSQKKDPGLNLALYDNKDADKLLEEARQTLDPDARKQKYDNFQKIVAEDIPAIFLYSPTYLYPVTKKVQGLDIQLIGIPSDRFSNINKWYIETKRVRR